MGVNMKHSSLKMQLRRIGRRKHSRTGRQKVGMPALLLVLGVIFLCLLGRLMGHTLQNTWQNAWQNAEKALESLPQSAAEAILLKNKGLVSYLVFREEERNSFRFFTECVLERGTYLAAAPVSGMQRDETNGEINIWQKQTDASRTFAAETGISETAAETELQEDGLLLTADGELLESVLSENAAWEGGFLPVSTVSGGVQRLENIAEQSTAGIVSAGETVNVNGSSALAGRRLKVLLENNYSFDKLSDVNYLLNQYYIVDSITSAEPELFDAASLLSEDLTLEEESGDYQILIYHTHASEGYADSREGEILDTVRGPGEMLAEYLRSYGYTVYHDMTAYDRKDGKDNRNYAYSTARPEIEAFLEEHPEVQVVIDLHRDSGAKRVTEIDGKATAKIMLFNGLCRNTTGPIADLENPNLKGNLAFSLQTNLSGRVLYPDLMYRIYLKNYRYNQHFRERCLLVELGTEQNTVEEACNAMKPFAEILDMVLKK